MADDNEFFDLLYQQWSKTSHAEKSYWMPEEDTSYQAGGPGTWNVVAVDANDSNWRWYIADNLSEEDADFICGLHGALPDLIRRLHEAVDEADSKDSARDQAEGVSAELALENMELREQVRELERVLDDFQAERDTERE